LTLLAGERLVLPGAVVDYLDDLRASGVSETTIAAERDGWTLLHVLAPDQVLVQVARKHDALADPAFRGLYVAFDRAASWDADDPRLPELAERMIAAVRRYSSQAVVTPAEPAPGGELVEMLLASLPSSHNSSWERLADLCRDRLRIDDAQAADPAVKGVTGA